MKHMLLVYSHYRRACHACTTGVWRVVHQADLSISDEENTEQILENVYVRII